MNQFRIDGTSRGGGGRRGVAMIVAIVCLTLVTAMMVSLVRLVLVSHQQVEREAWRMQSEWLAESGLWRASARLRSGDEYPGEEWVPAGIGPRREEGRVRIAVARDDPEEGLLSITVTADFPAHPIDRVRTVRTLTVSPLSEPDAQTPSESE